AAGGTIDVGDGIAALLAGGEAQVELVAGGAPVVRVTGAAPAVPASGVAVENAGNIILSHAGNDFVGTVDLRGDAVEIADAGTLALGTIGVNRLYARAATIDLASDVSTSGDQEYHGALELGADVALDSGGNVTFGCTVDGAHRLSAQAGDAVVLGGAVGSSTALAGLEVEAGTVTATSTVDVAGDLSVTVAAGGIIQSGRFRIGGNASFDAGSGDIVLLDAGNDFVGTVGLRGNSVSIADANVLGLGAVAADRLVAASGGALDLGHGVVAGAAEVRSTGAITQSGAFRVGGDARFDAGSGNIILSHAGNDFVGTVDLRGGAVEIADANTLALGTIEANHLYVRAAVIRLANGVSTSDYQTYDGALELGADVALEAGGHVLFGGAVDGAHRLSVQTAGVVVFGDAVGSNTTLSGLEVEAGAFRVGGDARFDAGSRNIVLTNPGNDFVGTVGLRGNSVSIADANVLGLGEVAADRLVAASGGALDLGHGVVAGAAEVRSNGAITQ